MSHAYKETKSDIVSKQNVLLIDGQRGIVKDFTIITTQIEDGSIQANILISINGNNYTNAIDNDGTNITIIGAGATRIENLPCEFLKIQITSISGKWSFATIGDN